MKREDVLKIFPEATEEQITNFLNENNSEVAAEKGKVKENKQEMERLKGIEAELIEEKKKSMSAEEKLELAEKGAKEKEREFVMKSNRLEAKNLYISAGISEQDAEKLLEKGVFESLEDTKAFAQSIVDLRKASIESAIQQTKEKLMDSTNTPGANSPGGEEKTEDVKFAEEVVASFGKDDKETENAFANY